MVDITFDPAPPYIAGRMMTMAAILPILVASVIWTSVHGASTCPDAKAITPCTCTTGPDGITIDCSPVESENQLAGVFGALNTTFNQLYEFKMENNQHIRVLRNGVFGSATFRKITVSSYILTEVQEGALSGSYNTLEWCKFPHNSLTTISPSK